MNEDFYRFEKEYWDRGLVIAGADEAGRGPLAGPVVAAALIIPPGLIIPGINDSKKLSEKKREALFDELCEKTVFSIGTADPETIDRINILEATRLAFRRAVEGLEERPAALLCDYITGLDVDVPWEAFVKGDARIYSVAAASIAAKVTRDRLMRKLDAEYPGYGFAKHKGYGTAEHIAAIKALGPSPVHRRSFISKFV